MKNIDEYVEEKAREFHEKLYPSLGLELDLLEIMEDFIRTIREDCKVRVNIKIFDEIDIVHYYKDRKRIFKEKLEKTGVEVEE